MTTISQCPQLLSFSDLTQTDNKICEALNTHTYITQTFQPNTSSVHTSWMTNINVLYNAKHFFIEHLFSFSTCFHYIVQLMFTIFQCLHFYPLNWRLWEWFQELRRAFFHHWVGIHKSVWSVAVFFVRYFWIMTTKLYTDFGPWQHCANFRSQNSMP